MFFGKPGRQFGWKLAAGVVGLAALTAAGVGYLTAGALHGGGHGTPAPAAARTEGGTAFPAPGPGGSSGAAPLAADAGLDALVPAALWKDCRRQSVAEPAAGQTAAGLPRRG